MSSNLGSRTECDRVVRLLRPRTWPLRVRLVGAVAVLGVGLCIAVGAGTLLAMRSYLVDQLDSQVREAQSRSLMFYSIGKMPFLRFSGPGPLFLDGPGQSSGTVGAVATRGTVTEAAVNTPTGNRQALSQAAADQLAQVPTMRMVSVALDGVGNYRLTAVPVENSDVVIIAGLPLSGVEATLASAAWIIGGSSLMALLATVAAGMVIIRRQLDPLSRMSLAAQRVASLQLDRGEVRLPTPLEPVDPATSHTEVGRLGTAFNTMVDRVAEGLTARHASETRVRQFVADASHELRTPLASIQGYTEFAERLLGDTDEHGKLRHGADLAHAMSRVRDESRRMNELVEDMLLLARLDTGRPIECERVDLSDLLINAVHDAHIAGPDHRWALDIPPNRSVSRVIARACTRRWPTCCPMRGCTHLRERRSSPPWRRTPTIRPRSPSPTTDRESPRTCCPTCSNASRAATAPDPASPVAPGSDSPSPARWSRRTTEPSASIVVAVAPVSPSRCPRRARRPASYPQRVPLTEFDGLVAQHGSRSPLTVDGGETSRHTAATHLDRACCAGPNVSAATAET